MRYVIGKASVPRTGSGLLGRRAARTVFEVVRTRLDRLCPLDWRAFTRCYRTANKVAFIRSLNAKPSDIAPATPQHHSAMNHSQPGSLRRRDA
jgi:hypothetical protein